MSATKEMFAGLVIVRRGGEWVVLDNLEELDQYDTIDDARADYPGAEVILP